MLIFGDFSVAHDSFRQRIVAVSSGSTWWSSHLASSGMWELVWYSGGARAVLESSQVVFEPSPSHFEMSQTVLSQGKPFSAEQAIFSRTSHFERIEPFWVKKSGTAAWQIQFQFATFLLASFDTCKLQDDSSELISQVRYVRYPCTNLRESVDHHILLVNYFNLIFNYLVLYN